MPLALKGILTAEINFSSSKLLITIEIYFQTQLSLWRPVFI